MKKPSPRHRRGSIKRKATQTRARSVPIRTKRRRLTLASSVVAVVLLGGGALTYEEWKDVQSPDPRPPVATRADTNENLNDDAAPRGGSVSSTLMAARGDSQASVPAKVQTVEESRDLGTMAVSEERSAEFSLRNVGGKSLEISQVRTSCMCTFAHVIVDDEQSPAFNMEMHNASLLQRSAGTVEPGQTAIVQITYKPSLMPLQGPVTRSVNFNTNDPARPIVELSIHANVQ